MRCVLDNACNILACITSLKAGLIDIVEPDFGLIDELRSLEVLSCHDVDDIRSEGTVYRRTEAILDLLATEDQCNKFIVALQQTDQQHVVNYINRNGG